MLKIKSPAAAPVPVINHASRVAAACGLFRLRPFRELCKRLSLDESLEFTSVHPVIRLLSEYQDLVHGLSTTKEKERDLS